jgi:hypothetical protein
MKLTRPIILEGPDGSGKSTLFKLMTEDWGLKSAGHDGGPPKDSGEAYDRLLKTEQHGLAVRDRIVAISDSIYSEVFKRKPKLAQRDYNDWLQGFDPIIVYCRPPKETILSQEVPVKLHKPEDHVKIVKANRLQITDLYDDTMLKLVRLGLIVYYYNWTKDPQARRLQSYLIKGDALCVE